ncbi:Rne/Rng family ribonuclease [Candidatus Chromulinivorax destructor]|uniref:Ribonuclease G n=1 Tax=Candidatus Chromulinivorax destructor TaxID=2066483 RepID=A0A345ZC02_9BACT|nr:Rne/Rng family ribonuclease [Candidatus Chromulinivorax destructor]AXK60819.1 Rne/Rng family ribonuclease [Candidatus Chromulinivorax destructor]
MKKILVNIEPWESRVAVLRDDQLENIYFSSATDNVIEKAFFKGTVIKVFPGIQTAFVEIGQERAGFLHISEIDRDLAVNKIEGADQFDIIHDKSMEHEDDQKQSSFKRAAKASISAIFKEGQEILVQVSKEPVGEKGAKLTTCFTLPGRFLVLMPNIGRIGISKKIGSSQERQRLRDILTTNLPAGMGAIIRTSAENADEGEVSKDIHFLLKDWNNIVEKYKTAPTKTKIHEEVDISLRVVRDHLDHTVESIITDSKLNQERIYTYLKNVAPEFKYKVVLHEGATNLFDLYNIDKQVNNALCKKVYLKSGGSIIIESTEAMTSIDVNTGRFTGKNNLEDTILKTNLEAAREIVRELHLRNIGGLIVIDFIDMNDLKNRQKLVEQFEKHLKEYDKFQSVVLAVSEFGLVQMTRKRSGKTLIRQLTESCQACKGAGYLKSSRAESYEVLRAIDQKLAHLGSKGALVLSVNPEIFDFISSIEFNSILALEGKFGVQITFLSKPTLLRTQFEINKQ